MNLVDPWSSSTSETQTEVNFALQFEDNFDPLSYLAPTSSSLQPQEGRLPDSDNYLALLERKLKKIRGNPTVLQQLSERREACMQYLLNEASPICSDTALDEPVNNHELLRFIKPEQALSVAELVHLVNHDHLEKDAGDREQEVSKEGEESGTESSTSR